ncbi:hypothetical protein Ahy_B04g072950 isoform E [Arachis hypogaea]|uniref:Uncharacterized protein n=1 Tax=Arachis hypogaea TaxID=3818 RepID=A0A444ZP83_ARAHY|nr:hypothetical protein Ahy_B04g072950 isoform E [Arachis hypogaea]
MVSTNLPSIFIAKYTNPTPTSRSKFRNTILSFSAFERIRIQKHQPSSQLRRHHSVCSRRHSRSSGIPSISFGNS